ncbi:sensor histidine kinase [Nocardiopsis potens]|uniref:sensor histidine kinase n=1 Tax=Nocardiopsis potens TaxID=1246458 RepID=UPI000349E755|nr:histidine kinase [Nocardiopsis potens]
MFYGDGEEERLREAFGDRLVGMWRWWWDRRHRIADWAIAICAFPWTALLNSAGAGMLLMPLSVLLIGQAPTGPSAPVPLQMAALLLLGAGIPGAISVAILFRRSRPNWLLWGAAAVLLLLGNPAPCMIALYSYASWFSDRRRLAMWSTVMAVVGAAAYTFGDLPTAAIVVFLLVCVALPLTLGLWVGTRRQLIGNLRERAERLEREQHLLADRAISAERTRIAREMHDVVAHRVSMMVLQAGGLEVSAADERTAEVAGLIRNTGREALSELREILGVLRETPGAAGPGDAGGSAPTAPQPVLADVERMIAEWRTAGMDVGWAVGGRPRPLPAQLERTAYRIVQEGLTNAGKHARGARVRARIDYGEHDLEITVANEPPPAGARTEAPPASGYGLAGLRERVALADGELTAGPYPDGGWQIRAVLPAGRPAAPGPP